VRTSPCSSETGHEGCTRRHTYCLGLISFIFLHICSPSPCQGSALLLMLLAAAVIPRVRVCFCSGIKATIKCAAKKLPSIRRGSPQSERSLVFGLPLFHPEGGRKMRLAVLCASAILGADAFMTTPTAMRPTLRATALSTPASFNGVSCVFHFSRHSSALIQPRMRVFVG